MSKEPLWLQGDEAAFDEEWLDDDDDLDEDEDDEDEDDWGGDDSLHDSMNERD